MAEVERGETQTDIYTAGRREEVKGRHLSEGERKGGETEGVAGESERKRTAGLYWGFRCERSEALFDIRHDFIKHSGNVQTLYIESYSLIATSLLALLHSSAPSARSSSTLSPSVSSRVRARSNAACNENIVPRDMPQYRIMYNYITWRGRRKGGWSEGEMRTRFAAWHTVSASSEITRYI